MSTDTAMPPTDASHGGISMALRIELRKLTTTHTWWVLGLVAVAVGAAVTVLTVAGADTSTHTPLEVFTGALVGGLETSYLVTAIVGITAVAGEYRHRTVTPSYLAVPNRAQLISAKLLVLFGYGLIVGVIVSATCSAIAGPWLAHRGLLNGSVGASGIARALIGGTVAVAIMTTIGVAIAALIHNQIAAVGVLLVYTFAIEQQVNNVPAIRGLYPFLPGGAVQSLSFSGRRAFGSATGAHLLNPWIGALVLIGYAVLITAAAVRTTIRNDIT